MEWPQSSSDLNPIENLWSDVTIELYASGKQYLREVIITIISESGPAEDI